jgi:hypothetical protein
MAEYSSLTVEPDRQYVVVVVVVVTFMQGICSCIPETHHVSQVVLQLYT